MSYIKKGFDETLNDPEWKFFEEVVKGRYIKELDDLKGICHGFKYYDDGYRLLDSSASVIHKIHALEYHLSNFIIKEKEHIKKAKELTKKGKIGLAIGYEPIDLICEFEAFLFQMKACLDIFSRSVGGYFGQNPSNIKKLRNVIPQFDTLVARRIISILKSNNWLKDFETENNLNKSMRDIITHYSTLNTSGIMVDNRGENPLTGKPKRRQVNKSKIKKKTLVNLMKEYYKNIFDMIDKIYRLIHKDIYKE